MGPFLFSLALGRLVNQIATHLPQLKFHAWYLDDGVFCGTRADLTQVLHLIDNAAPWLGLVLNKRKCEVYSASSLDSFHPDVIRSNNPNLEILGVPIGDQDFCSSFISKRCDRASSLLKWLPKLNHSQAALLLLRLCGGFCRLAHMARSTPPLYQKRRSRLSTTKFVNVSRTWLASN